MLAAGLCVVCAGLNKDPEEIGIHMLEILVKFRSEGVIEKNSTPEPIWFRGVAALIRRLS